MVVLLGMVTGGICLARVGLMSGPPCCLSAVSVYSLRYWDRCPKPQLVTLCCLWGCGVGGGEGLWGWWRGGTVGLVDRGEGLWGWWIEGRDCGVGGLRGGTVGFVEGRDEGMSSLPSDRVCL